MNTSIIPRTYEEWRHCITVECGLKLTKSYIEQRISALNDGNDYHTQQLTKLYGEQHVKAVLTWFQTAGQAVL